jgi:minor extracellular serine protease Vpr
MLKTSLRLLLACLCIAGLAVAPALAGDGAGAPGSVGGAANETPTSWFVELSSPPAVKGTSKATLKAERDAFKANAAADGVRYTERYSYDSLWNGLSVSVAPSQVSALGSIPGVKAIYPVHTISLPPFQSEDGGGANIELKNAVPMTGADIAHNELGLTGAGVTIAIMDSGVDYTLPELGGCTAVGPSCKVRGGFDLVGNAYDDTPGPGFSPIPHPDGDPAPCDPNLADQQEVHGFGTSNAGHGTHVAGIAAADGHGANQVVGVAPGAKLLAYRVFGCNGGTDTDVMIHAMELALADHADVLNMSIGSAFSNWPESPEAVAADNLVDAGMVVVASIGNSGLNGQQLWSAGSPGVAHKVIGVASFDNTKATLPSFIVGGASYGYNRAGGSLSSVPISGSSEIVFNGTPATIGDGCGANAPTAANVSGKIVFIRRGSAPAPAPTCGFYNKAINAQHAGAIGVVLYNNVAGALNPTVAPVPTGAEPVNIPVAAITAADGLTIFNGIASNHTLTWTNNTVEVPLTTAGTISDFSSWGTDAELQLKPDIGAPGGQIYSTWPHQQYGGHNSISGTSMASPHVAGLAALILQAKSKNITPAQVQTLLMNTSQPADVNVAKGSGFLEPTWRQGSGLAQIVPAVQTPAWVTPAKFSLGEGNGGSQQLTVTNGGSTPVTYDLSAVTTVGTGPVATAVYPYGFTYLTGMNPTSFSSSSVTVGPGSSATFTVNITAGGWPDKSLYGGYIVLTPRNGGETLRVPYVGFKGDYQSLPVLTSAGCGLPAVFKLNASASDACLGNGIQRLGAAGASFTLQGGDFPILLYHLNHQARQLNVQVYKANGSPVHPVFNYATQLNYLPRNSAANTFFEFDWDGTRSQDNGGGNGDHRKVVPNGTYVLKLSILKALGNANNAADWETFTTPPITLARP